jgi:hypothetical protein
MPKTATKKPWNAEAQAVRRLYVVIRSVLKAHPTEPPGEQASLVKDRLRALKLPWTPRQLDEALANFNAQPTPRPPPIREPAIIVNVDPPWRGCPREPSQWTRLRDLVTALTKRRSDPST